MTVHHRAVKFCVLGENVDSCLVTSNHHGEHPRQSHTDRGSATRVLACQQRWRVCSAAKESVLPRLLRAGLAPVCVGSRKGLAAGVGWSDPRNHVITSKVRVLCQHGIVVAPLCIAARIGDAAYPLCVFLHFVASACCPRPAASTRCTRTTPRPSEPSPSAKRTSPCPAEPYYALASLPPTASWSFMPLPPCLLTRACAVVSPTCSKAVPPYGRRQGFVPRSVEDFGDGGAFPEIHVAQYPLLMGKPGQKKSTAIVQVDAEGRADYDAILMQGRDKDQHVQSKFTDLVEVRKSEVRAGCVLERFSVL